MAGVYIALLSNRTWEIIMSHLNMNIVGSKWVFKIKENMDTSIERFKDRLVPQNFKQQHGLDYNETLSPIIKPQTIRVVLSLDVSSAWTIRQFDVNNSFLHGHLQELVYMKQPTGFTHHDYPYLVCKLNKAI